MSRLSLLISNLYYHQEQRMSKAKLHLVMGGRVENPQGLDFTELDKMHLVGVYPNFDEAEEAWRSAAQRTVDDAEMKYVVVHLHKLLEPDDSNIIAE